MRIAHRKCYEKHFNYYLIATPDINSIKLSFQNVYNIPLKLIAVTDNYYIITIIIFRLNPMHLTLVTCCRAQNSRNLMRASLSVSAAAILL